MLTPWFAVSIGIVIAASLTLAAPHAALSFPPRLPVRCAGGGCGARQPGGQPAINRRVRLHASDRHYVSARLSGVQVQYELLPRRHNGFIAVIRLVSRHPLGHWSLSFELPGAHITSIMWAKWDLLPSGGVIVRGSPLPWPRSSADETRIVIFGSGLPGWPAGCLIDGAGCVITPFVASASGPGR
jgi:hypothetical protein